jgi:hypothetical protein
LIEELEKEKADLQRLIDEAVKEQEFLSAHFHFEALGQINSRLQTLKNLDDELYDKKFFLGTGIENLRKRLKVEPDDHLKTLISRFIPDKEKELNELNQIPKKQKNINSKSHLRDYLDQFVRGKVRGLRIILSKKDNSIIEIRRARAGAKLTMPNIKKLKAEYLLTEERLLKLKGLGFSVNERGGKATATLSDGKDVMADKIMTLISLIVFEVFYFKELGHEATIEILSKRTGLNNNQ